MRETFYVSSSTLVSHLVGAALDQPNPSRELKRALNRVLLDWGHPDREYDENDLAIERREEALRRKQYEEDQRGKESTD